jgi:hypothetical protein
MLMRISQDEVAEIEKPAPPRSRALNILGYAATWFALSMITLVLRVALIRPSSFRDATGIAAILLFAVTVVVALSRAFAGIPKGAGLPIVGNLLLAGFSAFGMLIAYVATVGFSRGRQLRRFGRVLLPDLRPNADWAKQAMRLGEAQDAPAALADQWRENAKTEHASVAAFARLTLDLMALGAPPSLIAAANSDALDEIRHAELCFSIARALDGRDMSPAPFPRAQSVTTLPRSRTLAFAKLAVDSLVDGALHEGVSARIIAKLAQRCEVPGIVSVLRDIAADEGRHSAHGWAVVAWCLDQGGRPVAEALRGALRTLPPQMRSSLPQSAEGGGWERWGIHGHALEAEEYEAALAHLKQRVTHLTEERRRQAA